jgi:hypothetical protein
MSSLVVFPKIDTVSATLSLVLRINICGKNRLLRQARELYKHAPRPYLSYR